MYNNGVMGGDPGREMRQNYLQEWCVHVVAATDQETPHPHFLLIAGFGVMGGDPGRELRQNYLQEWCVHFGATTDQENPPSPQNLQ